MNQAPRPDPNRLLSEIREQEVRSTRGKLKVFFGACAGVGKTFAMLQAARARQVEGTKVLIGVVETHGREDTAALLAGLDCLAPRLFDYRDRRIEEFDLDAALEREPELIVVDELAHSNVNGSRHAKRWQDVMELLGAGIDVYTALNVQHLDSLNDIVASVTGVKVNETVPDPVFDEADEVTLVDLPPDDLLARLAAGKVYLPDMAEHAARNFFRKGNLIALREMSLRRLADRVDAQMQQWRRVNSVEPSAARIWETRERLIAVIGPGNGGAQLVRETVRLASRLQCQWIALHVERAGDDLGARAGAHAALRLAESLGGEGIALPAADVVDGI
ncbi:MAG: two-component system sensor histidine kinase KdbD, partial [Betaproteobacteria bacterium]|nr:two-component system sensor histidine kinase KdbD [Betaproteobacteria bacterium]